MAYSPSGTWLVSIYNLPDTSLRSLSGCVNMQFFVYWRLYSYESLRAKSLVRKLFYELPLFNCLHRSLQLGTFKRLFAQVRRQYNFRLLDLCHSAFVAIALWDSIIMPYSNMDESDNIPWYAWSHYSLSTRNLMCYFRSVGVSISNLDLLDYPYNRPF